MKTKKLYSITCPACLNERKMIYREYWAVKNRCRSEKCFKCSRFKKGETNSGGFKKGIIPWNKGAGNAGYWERIKKSKKWKDTRRVIFERDNWTCQICGIRGGILHPDHIKPKTAFPELAFELSNIRTLCRDCHKKTDTYGYKAKKIKDKIINALK